MKKIKAIQGWVNGSSIQGTEFQLYAINVNLENSAVFYYAIFSEDKIKISEGNLSMQRKDYQDWQNDEFAWDWAAKQLNLQILPEIIEEKDVIL
jgi:hypothetical protein